MVAPLRDLELDLCQPAALWDDPPHCWTDMVDVVAVNILKICCKLPVIENPNILHSRCLRVDRPASAGEAQWSAKAGERILSR